VIPTMLLVGVLTRRLWLIPVGAVAWGALLLATGVVGIGGFPSAAFVGGANIAIGVLVHRAIAWPLRRTRPTSPRPDS
jgi:hypothetical protein